MKVCFMFRFNFGQQVRLHEKMVQKRFWCRKDSGENMGLIWISNLWYYCSTWFIFLIASKRLHDLRTSLRSRRIIGVPWRKLLQDKVSFKSLGLFVRYGKYINQLGGGFKYFLFSSLFGKDNPIWLIFFKGVESWNHQPVNHCTPWN